ncbi:hypothetical protein [Paraburkholderia franconis]|uniref:hypothetical protein n=1 Tax=Paraburkholderia franconis TaxID=2654983 RepID=UPI00187B91F8|nr:hypothetical protein [Paraburkholderia franconis]
MGERVRREPISTLKVADAPQQRNMRRDGQFECVHRGMIASSEKMWSIAIYRARITLSAIVLDLGKEPDVDLNPL